MRAAPRPGAGWALALAFLTSSFAISNRQARVRSFVQRASQPVLLVPQPNDTIPESYWNSVDQALLNAGQSTSKPISFNDPAATPALEPWDKILNASKQVIVLDTNEAMEANLINWESATPMPPVPGEHRSSSARKMSVLPYDMQLGARIMSGITVHSPSTPIPTQDSANQAFASQCPMLVFGKSLAIRAPSCGDDLGSWEDTGAGRVFLRWQPNSLSGIRFGVDSVVTGKGSVPFATLDEKLSIDNKYKFYLRSCLGVISYAIEETILKVHHMALNADSTMVQHDLAKAGEAFFYQYTVTLPNGSLVAQTNLYRRDRNQVNISLRSDTVAKGTLLAVANRQGNWQRDKWRECSSTPRGWTLDFPLALDVISASTVQDMRIVSAAVITLMALRDEKLGSDGLQNGADSSLHWSMVMWALLDILVIVSLVAIALVFRKKGVDKKLRLFCFRLEAVLLPKRPAFTRTPALNLTY